MARGTAFHRRSAAFLSATVIGSGIAWGEEIEEAFRYTLDPSKGASMLHVPFAHTIDALSFVLNEDFVNVSGALISRRSTIRMIESQEVVPFKVADQIAFTGKLASGALITSHFRGGLSRATNFHLEINGSRGDLLLTSPVGYVGLGGFSLIGLRTAKLCIRSPYRMTSMPTKTCSRGTSGNSMNSLRPTSPQAHVRARHSRMPSSCTA
jgi:predicted dehydrogenase